MKARLRPLNIRRRLLGEPFDTRERAKPKRLLVEMEISSGTPRIHLHLTDGIDRVFARKAGQDYFIQIKRLRQVSERNQPLMLDLDPYGSCPDECLRNMLRAQNLATGSSCRYSRRKIHRRAKVAVVAEKRGAMMQSGANNREIPAIGDRCVEDR